MHERLTEAAAQALKQEVPLIEAALLRIRAALNEDSTECAHCHLRLKAANRDCQLAALIHNVPTAANDGSASGPANHATGRFPKASLSSLTHDVG